MNKFGGVYAYTQSDELTIVCPAAPVVRNQQQQHANNGRLLKLCTTAAAHVTVCARVIGGLLTPQCVQALFNHLLADDCARRSPPVAIPLELLPGFDCRLGAFKHKQQATKQSVGPG